MSWSHSNALSSTHAMLWIVVLCPQPIQCCGLLCIVLSQMQCRELLRIVLNPCNAADCCALSLTACNTVDYCAMPLTPCNAVDCCALSLTPCDAVDSCCIVLNPMQCCGLLLFSSLLIWKTMICYFCYCWLDHNGEMVHLMTRKWIIRRWKPVLYLYWGGKNKSGFKLIA